MCRSIATLVILLGAATSFADDPKPRRVLPGKTPDGFVQLPNQWKLNPAGKQIEVGDLPVNIQFHPTGQFAAVLHNGYKEHEVVILDLNPSGRKVLSRVVVPQSFYGLAFSPDGKQLYASGGEFDVIHVWDFDKGYLHNPRKLSVESGKQRMVPAGLALDAAGKDLFVAALWANAVVRMPLDNPDNRTVIKLGGDITKPEIPQGDPPSPPDGRREIDATVLEDLGASVAKDNAFPYAVLPEPGGKRLFVSLWANAKVAVIDLESNKVSAGWSTASHPTEMALSPDGKQLYVACANSTKVSVIDTATGNPVQTIHCALYPQAPNGNTPSSLCLTPDGQLLLVANADANNLTVFNVADPKIAKPLGFIPTGWYPTSVRFNKLDRTIYVANGKGLQSKPNPYGANPEKPANTLEYIGSLFKGTVSVIPQPTPAAMANYSKTAYACSPLQAGNAVRAGGVEAGNPIPKKLGDPSPIKYVIYVIKENRTYDQVFGDMAGEMVKKGNGEPTLCLFPRTVTSNHHKLADEFVLLDNLYCDGEVSADGHEWSMGAYATDFVEKMWPLSYRGSPKKTFGYPAEGAMDTIARPAGGYLWDRAKEAGVTYRNYGEWVENGKRKNDGTFEPGRATVKTLEGHIDPLYRGYDLAYTDAKRAERFLSEVKRFEQAGEMPRLQIVRLPNDHTLGTRVGKPTPTAMVAENDLGLGILVEGVSKSKFWKETAIFVIEDDSQNGPDHVDAHRTGALVISPYTKRGVVDSTMYSTSSMLHTMELILGLKPMSQFDAAARPMYASFTAKPDLTPYSHVIPSTDMNAVNGRTAFGAAVSAKLDLDDKEDQADDLVFNEIIWKSVKGANSKVPAPVRAAFFVPVTGKKEDKD
ncbi:MAG TPA: alkaline phosphatase family protein [Fimbriiglobus sp.]|jgi:YVTN family beta-propeller protein